MGRYTRYVWLPFFFGPILKGGDKAHVEECRPLCLSSFSSKFLKEILESNFLTAFKVMSYH